MNAARCILCAAATLACVTMSAAGPVELNDSLRSYARGQIEEAFIEALRLEADTVEVDPAVDPARLKAVPDCALYVLEGPIFRISDISADTYFYEDSIGEVHPVYSADFPAQTLANLLMLRSPQANHTNLDLTVLRHEYGEKEQITTSVGTFIAYAIGQGCQPYWGVERIADDGLVEGALFLYNEQEGYNHTLKIECRPAEVVAGTGAVKARASLFIPTANSAPQLKILEKSANGAIK